MKLNHLGITVTDVLAASDFLETYSGLEPVGKKRSDLCGSPYEAPFAFLQSITNNVEPETARGEPIQRLRFDEAIT